MNTTSLPLSDSYLQQERFTLVLDSTEIENVCVIIGIDSDGITGMLVEVLDGEYGEVWSTGYSRPFDLSSIYSRVS